MERAKLKLRILHLSDLHAGECWWAKGTRDKARYAGEQVHNELVDLLEQYHPGGFDLIAVTGDVTEHADYQEFSVTTEFIRGVQNGLMCHTREDQDSRPYLCIVPGNHDVDRGQLEKAEAEGQRLTAEENYKRKFSPFIQFTSDLAISENHARDFTFKRQFTFIRPKEKQTAYDKVEANNRKQRDQERDIPEGKGWCAIGLNSATKESHLDKHHYGHIDINQINIIEKRCLQGFSPWEFRFVLMHHQPVIVPYWEDIYPDAIDQAKRASKSLEQERKEIILNLAKKLNGAANYLHNSKNILQNLEKIGCQLVLTGHYHFAEPQHYAFAEPEEKGNPFGHCGITVLRSASFGLRKSPRFQVLEVYKDNFRFKIKVYHYVVELDFSGYFVEYKRCGKVNEYNCYSDRPTRIIDGLSRVLSFPESPENKNDFKKAEISEKFEAKKKFILWHKTNW